MKYIFFLFPVFVFAQLNSNYELSVFDSGYVSPMQTEFINESNYLVLERAGKVYLNGVEIIERSPNTIGEGGMLSMLHKKVNGIHNLWIYSTEAIDAVDIEGNSLEIRYGNISLYHLDLVNESAVFIDDILSDFLTFGFNHFGGSLLWLDGALVCGFGDNQSLGKAQGDEFLNGKFIRINPFTGEGHPDNVLYDSNNPLSVQSRIFAKGFRNPFRSFVYDSVLGLIAAADVGAASWEELTIFGNGENAGWWLKEGFEWQTSPQEIVNEVLPAFAYSHGSTDFQTSLGQVNFPFNGSSIIGGVRLNQFGFDGGVLFSDFFRDELLVAQLDENNILTNVESLGFMPMSFNVHYTQFNGFMYVTNLANGNIYQIEFGGSLSLNEPDINNGPYQIMRYNFLGQRDDSNLQNVPYIELKIQGDKVETKKYINHERY